MRPLDDILTRRQRKAGLYLEEEEDHFLLLKRGGRILAVFSQTGTTVEAIRQEADKHLEKGQRDSRGEKDDEV